MNTLRQDLRYGARMLLKKPGFTLIAVLTLALGIGANTAIFSMVNGVLLKPLPYPEPERLVMVWEKRPQEGVYDNVVAPADFRDWQARNRVFENIAAQIATTLNMSGQGEPERVRVGNVSASFFDVLGVKPVLGRSFLAEEEQKGRNQVAVLSHGLRQRRFGSETDVIGRTIHLNGEPYEVIGVLPPTFRFADAEIELWYPLDFTTQRMQARAIHFLNVFARLKPGVTLEQARDEMERIGAQLAQEFPQENGNHSAWVVPLREQWIGDVRPALLILLGAVSLVLLIACANVANLHLVRAASRQKEMAIRAALGASRARIVRQLLTESLGLAVVGGGAGTLLAMWSVDAIALLVPQDLVQLNGAQLDLRVFGFTLALSLVTGMLTGAAAAWSASRQNLNEMLKEGGRSGGGARHRTRSVFVMAEVALAIVLLAGAGLMLRSLLNLQQVAPGFNAKNVLTAHVSLPVAKYRERQQAALFFQQLIERVGALPGVKATGATAFLPLDGGDSRTGIAIEGRESNPDEPTRAHPRVVTAGYYQAMGIRLVSGRLLSKADNGQAPPVALINEAAAERYWPGRNPVGSRLRLGGTEEWREIVGVIGDVRHWGLDSEVQPEVYLSWDQFPQWGGNLVVSSEVPPTSLAGAIRQQLHSLDKDLPLARVLTMDEVIAASITSLRSYALLLALFAGVALLLAGIGIYGVMAYAVTQRTHEIGVRMALGAQPGDVLRLVIRQGLLLALVGVAIGLTASFALTRVMKSLLFGVSATDPVTFGGVALLLTMIALAACYIPARRAARVDPMVALRYE